MHLMTWPSPLDPALMNDAQQDAFERARTKLQLDTSPEWLLTLAHSPELLRDVTMNLTRHVLEDAQLDARDKLFVAMTIAAFLKAPELATTFARLGQHKRADLIEAAALAASITSHNTYYKMRAQCHAPDFARFASRLRATPFLNPSCGPVRATLVQITVSALNDCASCVNHHTTRGVEKLGLTHAQIDEALRASAITASITAMLGR